MAIVDLTFHPFAYVTIAELAEYWRLRKDRVLDHIKAGHVEAIQLGPDIYRVRTSAALAFEQRCTVSPVRRLGTTVTWRRSSLGGAVDEPSLQTPSPDELCEVPAGNGDPSGESQ